MDLTQTIPAEFEIEGFLSPKMSKVPIAVRKEYQEWFDFARSTNKLCQEALYNFDVKEKEHARLARSLLYLHNLQLFQSVVICLENGMTSQAQILLRTMIETLFKLKAITNDHNNVRQYGVETILSQISFGQSVIELNRISDEDRYTPDEIKSARGYLIELTDKKKELGGKRWQVKEWAEKANLVEYYLSNYQLFCQPVHASGSHIDSFIIKNSEGDLKEINPLPEFKLIDAYIHVALGALLTSLQCVEKLTKKTKGRDKLITRRKQAFTKLNKLIKNTK